MLLQDRGEYCPQLRRPGSKLAMMNEFVSDTNPEAAVSCMAISNDGRRLLSASGGGVSMYDMRTFEVSIRVGVA